MRLSVLPLAVAAAFPIAAVLVPLRADDEPAPAAVPVDFETRVAPLLAARCLECHGPAAPKGGLDLSRRAAALDGGRSGPAIVPGDLDESLLWEHVEADRMPPRSRGALDEPEKAILRAWIAAGAAWPDDLADIARFVRVRDPSAAWVRRLTRAEYVETVRELLGVDVEREARELLPRERRADGFSNTAYNLNVDLPHVEGHAKLAKLVADRVDVARLVAEHAGPDPGDLRLRDERAARFVASLARKLFRAPPADSETASLLRVVAAVRGEGGDDVEAARYVVEAALQSPRFLYRLESEDTPHALASRVAYALWGAPPDDALAAAADSGALRDPDTLARHVRRMLEDPRAVAHSLRFVSEWIDLDRLDALRPDPKRFPKWDPQLAADMREETLAFFEEVAWRRRRPLAELMNAPVAFLSPRLAEHYGLDDRANNPDDTPPANPGGLAGRAAAGLVALYTFDEPSGSVVRDVSGAGEPIDLVIADPAAVERSPGRLVVKAPTRILSENPPGRLVRAWKASNAATIEAWVAPASKNQPGPARILTLSDGPSRRNFTLGQDGTRYQTRFRTSRGDVNGQPTLDGPTNILYDRPTHVAFTRDPDGRAVLYIDGEPKAERALPGDLANWDDGFRLALANEITGDRPWRGTFHLVALYDRALSPVEIRGNARGLARLDLAGIPERGGLPTQGAFLTVGGDDASTVARGLFILRELLHDGVDDPPPCVDTTPAPLKPGVSRRAVAMSRIENPSCAGCHAKFEYPALALEIFDGLGSRHEKDEHGNPLREDGFIQFPGDDQPTPFRSARELVDRLAASPRVSFGLTRKIAQFALGRPLEVADEPELARVHQAALDAGGTYADVMAALANGELLRIPPASKSDADPHQSESNDSRR